MAGLVITIWAAAGAWTFVLLYWLISQGRWRFTEIGRHLMALAAVDGLVFTLLLFAYIFPKTVGPFYQWLYLGSVAGIPFTTTWRTIIMIRLYHRKSRLAVVSKDPAEETG